jgi:hydroxymethylbilane synthase
MKEKRRIVVATRKSALALAQCRQFIQRLVERHPHLIVEELHVVTTGDMIVDRPLAEIGGKGLFLKEIEESLLSREADIAVHSMKDVPPELHPELMIGCIPEREDPRDVIVTTFGGPLSEVPRGGRLGTSSLRRAVQLLRFRPDLQIEPIRGNVGTRIQKCRDGVVDVTVLAQAGVNRLGLQGEVSETLSPEVCLPAVGQGALAIELRRGEPELHELLLAMQHEETALRTLAERGVMEAVEGDCKTPVAAFAERKGDEMRLRALLSEPDGSRFRQRELLVPWPQSEVEASEIGRRVGKSLKQD